MESFVENIKQYAVDNSMFDDCDTVIVGLSAGADSICLLTVLDRLKEELGIRVVALHVHHGIRGEEAKRDAMYAASFCEKMNIEFRCIKAQVLTLAKQWHVTTEEAGRNVRYSEFSKWANELESTGAKVKIAVAHNMNDNAETVLFNIFRGSMLDGLGGIPPVNGKIIRPLLKCKREDIEKFLELNGIGYCTDSTNLANEYTRNITRHRILPVATRINSRAVEHITNIASMSKMVGDFIDKSGQAEYDKIVESKSERKECNNNQEQNSTQNNSENNILIADMEKLRKLHPVILSWIIRQMIKQTSGRLKDIGEVHIRMCEDLVWGQTGREVHLPYGIVAKAQYDKLVMESIMNKNETDDKTCIEISKNDEKAVAMMKSEQGMEIKVTHGTYKLLIINKIDEDISKNDYTKYYDYDRINFVFSLRTRNSKDYIVVNSNGTAKKLSRFFIDNKVPSNIREELVMVAVGDEIIFIPGYRGGESLHVTKATRMILKVTYTPDNF